MTPDSTYRPASREPLGLARFIAGLVLLAVTAACSPGGQDVTTPVGSTLAPTPAITTSSNTTEVSSEPSSIQTESMTIQDGGLKGPYTLRIPRIGVDAPVAPIQSNEERILEPPRDPGIAGWWSDGAAPGEPQGSVLVVGHTVRNKGKGVFNDMGDLSGGDAIEVAGSDSTLTYRVRSIDVLSKDEVARSAEQIFAQTAWPAGPYHLRRLGRESMAVQHRDHRDAGLMVILALAGTSPAGFGEVVRHVPHRPQQRDVQGERHRVILVLPMVLKESGELFGKLEEHQL
jgi:LPXTG-site transpeptidase (sortase) family protein